MLNQYEKQDSLQREITRRAHDFCEKTEEQYVGTKVNEVLYAKEC